MPELSDREKTILSEASEKIIDGAANKVLEYLYELGLTHMQIMFVTETMKMYVLFNVMDEDSKEDEEEG